RLPRASLGGDVVKRQAIVVLSGMLLLGPLTLDGSERVTVRAPSTTTSDLRISVGVERRDDNRMVRVTVESSDFFRSSEIPLNGEASPRLTVLTFHQVPSGEYDVRAELIVEGGRTGGVARCNVTVF